MALVNIAMFYFKSFTPLPAGVLTFLREKARVEVFSKPSYCSAKKLIQSTFPFFGVVP